MGTVVFCEKWVWGLTSSGIFAGEIKDRIIFRSFFSPSLLVSTDYWTQTMVKWDRIVPTCFLDSDPDFRMCCLSCVCMPTNTSTLKRIVALGLSQNSSLNIMSWIPPISPLPPLSNGSCLISCGCELSETSWKIVNHVWSYVLDILEESLCIFLGRKYSAYANCCWLFFHSISFICFVFTAT